MEGSESVRRPQQRRSQSVKDIPKTISDAWGPAAIMGRRITGTTPTPTAPITETPLPETDEDYAEYYRDKINQSHNKQLYPLMEDLADWINKTLDFEYLQGGNLLDMLDNGVLLCQLAKLIQEKAEIAATAGYTSPPIPTISTRCFKTAARRSFFSRDNTEKFIQFCKKLGVHQNLLFESDDLVLQNKPRNVVLCLMEVSRLVTRFGIEPPGLVKFEREIAEEEEESQHDSGLSHDSVSSWNLNEPPQIPIKPHRSCISAIPISNGKHYNNVASDASEQNLKVNGRSNLRRATSEGAHMNGILKSDVNGNSKISQGCTDRNYDEWSRASSEDHSDYGADKQSIDDLDKKVQRASHMVQKHCRCAKGKCEKLQIKKVGEGKYTIGGRNVFIRLLKGKHMMVRVGGGWDTLENFLARHDPCQSVGSKSVSRTNSPSPPKNTSNFRRHSNPHYRSSPVDSLVSR